MKYFLSIIVFLLFFSCKKEANVKLPDTKPLPVIYCYINPADSFIRLKLTLSQPIYGVINANTGEPVKNANVSISSAQGNAGLVYNQNGYYQISTTVYPVVPGQKYKVEVRLADGGYAEAETTVPINTVPVLNVSYQTIVTTYNTFDRLKVNFKDDADAGNYYTIMYEGIDSSFFSGYSSGYKKLYADKNHNGELTDILMDAHKNSQTVYAYDIFLLNCNYDYYTFYKSIENYQEGNPFAEPSLTYTNVKGGLGVFAAFTFSTYRLNL